MAHDQVIIPIVPKHNWRILTDDDIELLQDATFEILENVGVHFPLRKALDIFAEHGAKVDFDKEIVRLPTALVKKAMSTAPRYFKLGGREPRYDFELQKNYTFFSNDGSFPHTMDFQTREKRESCKQDIIDVTRIVDYLEPVAFTWPATSATEYGETAPLHEIHAALSNGRKHVQAGTVMGKVSARYAVEMALAISGDAETMRERPPLSGVIDTTDPLGQNGLGLETALVFAEAGLPVVIMAMPTMMSTAPATPSGALAVGNAAVISGITLLQLAFPGAPVLHSLGIGVMDPHTAAYLMHTPLATSLWGAAIELAHANGLPCLAGEYGTDAFEPGWQHAKEHGRSALIPALLGAEMVVGFGSMASVTTLSPENLILDIDQFYNDLTTATGFQVNRETLALDVIESVGPRGNYLMEKHTIEHMRKIPFSELVMESRKKENMGADGVIEAAWAKAMWILENHEPEPLEPHAQAEIDRIIATADREIKGDGEKKRDRFFEF